MPADDPTELFDVVDADGSPLGRSKPRGEVHRDGDWHKSVHIWVVLVGAASAVVLQRRSLKKDSHPGAVDVSVAGHLRAGESADAGLREAEEEIGLRLPPGDLVHLGTRRKEDCRGAWLDREIQEIFCVFTKRDLQSLRPDPDEVAGVLSVALPDALALFEGEVSEVGAREIREGSRDVGDVVLQRSELLPGGDNYFADALRAIVCRIEGVEEGLTTFR